ncbi:porin [Andreprevotia chitinilytica]|uniref:porin n=1 Tax=Andreprevotia chitinilytica TaxID=396808 RepID=UPI00068E51E7|nr:porin [Andreprevotia chitinilytica]
MKKYILAATIAAVPAMALADVTIYGKLGAGLNFNHSYNSVVDANGNPVNSVKIGDYVSRIGFKGSDKLDSGDTAIWQVENRIHVGGSNSKDLFGTRDSFIGLQGNWGTFRAGHLSDYANLDMEYIDPLSYGGDVAGQLYSTRIDHRFNNAIRYDSPDFGGFTFTTLYNADTARVAGTNSQAINVGLSFERAGYLAKLNYEAFGDASQLNQATNAGTLKDWWRFEGGYIKDELYVVGAFQQANGYLGKASGQYVDGPGTVYNVAALQAFDPTSSKIATTDQVRAQEAVLTAGYKFGKAMPFVELTRGFDLKAAGKTVDNTGYKQGVLGVQYTLSKATTGFASAGIVKWDGSGVATERSVSVGFSTSF